MRTGPLVFLTSTSRSFLRQSMAASGLRSLYGISRGPGMMYEDGIGSLHRAFKPSVLLAEEKISSGQALKEERQRKAEEEQVSSEWRANRLQELKAFLRKANRSLDTGPETQKAIKELTLLQENPGMGPPPDVLEKLMKKTAQNGTSNGVSSSRAPPSPPEKAPSNRPLSVNDLLHIQLRERGEELLRQREREKQEVQAKQEAKSAKSKRRARVKQVCTTTSLFARLAGPERRREVTSKSQKKGPLIVGFEESRRKAALHGITVTRTRPKPVADSGLISLKGNPVRPEDEVVSTGVNGVVKPAKRWVGGKVIVEKRTGTSTVTYNPPGRVGQLNSPVGIKLDEACPIVKSIDSGGGSTRNVSEEEKQSPQSPICSNSSSSDSDSDSSLSSLSPSPEPDVRRLRTPPGTPRTQVNAKTPERRPEVARPLPGSPCRPQGPVSVDRTPPFSDHSKANERPRPPSPAFRSAPPGGRRLSSVNPPASQTHPSSGVSSALTKQKLAVNGSVGRLTSNSRAPPKCVIPGSKSPPSTTAKSASSASRPRHAPVPDLTGASAAPRKYICGVPQPPRRLCVIGNNSSSGPKSFIPAVAAAEAASTASTGDRKRSRDGSTEEEAAGEAELPPWRRQAPGSRGYPGGLSENGEATGSGQKRFRSAPWRSRMAPPDPDSDMSDFIVDDEEEEPDWRTEMRAVTGYDPSKYGGIVEECEESSFLRQSAEERVSSIVAQREDDEEYRKILEEEREERRSKKMKRS